MKKVVSVVVSAAICFTSMASFPVLAAGVPQEYMVTGENVGDAWKACDFRAARTGREDEARSGACA